MAKRPEITGRRSATRTENVEPLVVRPRVAWQMLGCGNTHGYRLLDAGEIESFLDGKARKITVSSIHAFIARKLAAFADDGKKPAGAGRRKGRFNSSESDRVRPAA